jgi:hypothetical protein
MMLNMNDTPTQLVQPPPHDLPATPGVYAGWTLAGIAVYAGFFVIVGLVAAAWHELRWLRRDAATLTARLEELRATLRSETHR